MTDLSNDVLTIPQAILDAYTAAYNNVSYRRFGDALAVYLPREGEAYGQAMNSLIDTCYERLGSTFYNGACNRLAEVLIPLADDHLLVLAEAHLRAFSVDESDVDGLLTARLLGDLDLLRTGSQNALVLAGDHHRWPGRVAFYWLNAINLLLTATIAVLQGEGSSYVREKFLCALRALANGVGEAAEYGLLLAVQLTAWFNNAPRQ